MLPCVIVGIAGGSASGKSMLTSALAAALERLHQRRVRILTTDRYMQNDRSLGPTFFSHATGTHMFDANHPDAIAWNQVLRDLDDLLQQTDGPEVILVEGHLLLHEPTVRARLDIRLFVDLDADERALRRLLRDMQGGRANRDPHFIATYYRESARVGHMRYIEPSRVHADLIVRGDAIWERIEPLLVAIIEDRLAHATLGSQPGD
jgi:uridine kinase